MRTTLIMFGGIAFAIFLAYVESTLPTLADALEDTRTTAVVPLPPDTSRADAPQPAAETSEAQMPEQHAHPVHIAIPSIELSAPVVPVGILENGEMGVPSGRTNHVGWFQHGTIPGNRGSAVMDAHVYAAFKDLRYARIGDTITVTTEDGAALTYRIISSMVYPKDQLPMQTIFADESGAYLNLITCAGKYLRDHETYSHRLVVYAELVA